MHSSSALAVLVSALPVLGVAGGFLGAVIWRRRAVVRGANLTVLRAGIAVFNGVAVGLVAGITLFLLLAVSLPPPA